MSYTLVATFQHVTIVTNGRNYFALFPNGSQGTYQSVGDAKREIRRYTRRTKPRLFRSRR